MLAQINHLILSHLKRFSPYRYEKHFSDALNCIPFMNEAEIFYHMVIRFLV